jgi:hypothetical protein
MGQGLECCGRGKDYLLDIGSDPGKQGNFPVKSRKSGIFGIGDFAIDLPMSRTVNGAV